MSQVITLKKVSVTRANATILKEISVHVEKGEIVGLLGPSGAGKTTVMRVIMGLQKPTSGSVSVLGFTPTSIKVRGRVGYVTQAPSVYQDLTVLENLQYFARILGVGAKDVEQTAELVGLASYHHRLTSTLSGGQRSRVSLAAALLGNPVLLVLDEPTVGLDPVLRQELWVLFQKLAQNGTSLLISSHVMDEAEHCDCLLLLRDGTLIAEGAPSELKEQTHSATIEQAFLQLVSSQQ